MLICLPEVQLGCINVSRDIKGKLRYIKIYISGKIKQISWNFHLRYNYDAYVLVDVLMDNWDIIKYISQLKLNK